MLRSALRVRRRLACANRASISLFQRTPLPYEPDVHNVFQFDPPKELIEHKRASQASFEAFDAAVRKLPDDDRGEHLIYSFGAQRPPGFEEVSTEYWTWTLIATVQKDEDPPTVLRPWVTRNTLYRHLPEGTLLSVMMYLLYCGDAAVRKYEPTSAEAEIRRMLDAQNLPLSTLMAAADHFITPSLIGQRARSLFYSLAFEEGRGVLEAGYKLATLIEFDIEPEKKNPPRLMHHRDYVNAILAELLATRDPLAFQGYAEATEYQLYQTPKEETHTRQVLRDLMVKRLDSAMGMGLGKAWATMARHHEEGVLVPRDTKAAVEHYRKAIEQGHVESNYKLGKAYELGWIKGDPTDSPTPSELALKHFEDAADVNGDSAYEAGLRYYNPLKYELHSVFNSHTPEELLIRSEAFFTSAAELKCRRACIRLAEGLLRGEFGWKMTVLDRLEKARQWFTHAQRLYPRWDSPVQYIAEDSPLKRMDQIIDTTLLKMGLEYMPTGLARHVNFLHELQPRQWTPPELLPAAETEVPSDVSTLGLSERLRYLKGSVQLQAAQAAADAPSKSLEWVSPAPYKPPPSESPSNHTFGVRKAAGLDIPPLKQIPTVKTRFKARS